MSGTLEVVALALSWTVVVEMEDERVLVAADEDEPWRVEGGRLSTDITWR